MKKKAMIGTVRLPRTGSNQQLLNCCMTLSISEFDTNKRTSYGKSNTENDVPDSAPNVIFLAEAET